MEKDTPNQQTVIPPTQDTLSESTNTFPESDQKRGLPLIVGVTTLLILISGGLFYFGTKGVSQQQMANQPVPEIATPSVTLTVTPILTSVSTSTCNKSDELLSIQPSHISGWCLLSLPLQNYSVTGYSLQYPAHWTVRLAGAEGMNVLFNEKVDSGSDSQVFVQITTTKLPLELSDQAAYTFEMSEPEALIDPNESVVSKQIITIGDKQVLHVTTNINGTIGQRYFLQHAENGYSSLYMFAFSGEDKQLVESVNDMVVSMTFAK